MRTHRTICGLLLPYLLVVACQQRAGSPPAATPVTAWQQGRVLATDSAAYGLPFLQQLAAANYPDSICLTADMLLLGQSDTVWLPLQAEGDSLMHFAGKTIHLQVSRLNRTTFQVMASSPASGGGAPQVWWNGPMVLQPLFFLGAEVQEDPNSGEPIGMCTYRGQANNRVASLLLSVEPHAPHWAQLTITQQPTDSVLLRSGMIKQR